MNKIIISLTLITLAACTNNIIEHHIQCESNTATIEFDNSTMELIINNNRYHLNKVASASGIKYQSQLALVWLKGDDAIIEFDNIKLKYCKLINTLQVPND